MYVCLTYLRRSQARWLSHRICFHFHRHHFQKLLPGFVLTLQIHLLYADLLLSMLDLPWIGYAGLMTVVQTKLTVDGAERREIASCLCLDWGRLMQWLTVGQSFCTLFGCAKSLFDCSLLLEWFAFRCHYHCYYCFAVWWTSVCWLHWRFAMMTLARQVLSRQPLVCPHTWLHPHQSKPAIKHFHYFSLHWRQGIWSGLKVQLHSLMLAPAFLLSFNQFV